MTGHDADVYPAQQGTHGIAWQQQRGPKPVIYTTSMKVNPGYGSLTIPAVESTSTIPGNRKPTLWNPLKGILALGDGSIGESTKRKRSTGINTGVLALELEPDIRWIDRCLHTVIVQSS
jgi:hypothetical protein